MISTTEVGCGACRCEVGFGKLTMVVGTCTDRTWNSQQCPGWCFAQSKWDDSTASFSQRTLTKTHFRQQLIHSLGQMSDSRWRRLVLLPWRRQLQLPVWKRCCEAGGIAADHRDGDWQYIMAGNTISNQHIQHVCLCEHQSEHWSVYRCLDLSALFQHYC